jgi:hypothetical protein
MKQRTTVGFMAVFAGALLATVTSVSANHVATGKGTYSVSVAQVLAGFHFVVTRSGQNFLESEMARTGGPMSFQTFMISTTIDSFTIPDESTETDERTVTIEGEMESTTFFGVGPARQTFAELVPFTAIGVDKKTSEEPDADHFSLIVEYSSSQDQGPLFARLGFGDCVGETCTITFEGPVKTGHIFVHTSGSD